MNFWTLVMIIESFCHVSRLCSLYLSLVVGAVGGRERNREGEGKGRENNDGNMRGEGMILLLLRGRKERERDREGGDESKN